MSTFSKFVLQTPFIQPFKERLSILSIANMPAQPKCWTCAARYAPTSRFSVPGISRTSSSSWSQPGFGPSAALADILP